MIARKPDATGLPRLRIDWPAIHRRLENAAALLERGQLLTAEQTSHILKIRARALAGTQGSQQAPEQQLTILEFLLAHEKYAIEAAFVREVYPLKELTPLPGTPPFVRGIINVRGQIISVVDPKKFFDLPQQGLTDLNKVIIVRDERIELGLLADAIVGVHAIALRDIQPPLPTLTGIREEYLHGVTEQRLVVLNIARMLADPKLIVRADAHGPAVLKELP